MKQTVDWILARLGEQSTWKGIIGLITAAGIALKPEQVAAISSCGIALIALINVFRNESKPPTPPTPTVP